MKKIRPPFKTHGGKFYLSDWIISYFPPEYEKLTYLEPFGGAASVLLNKKTSVKEMYNDLHKPTASIFFNLVNKPKEVIDSIAKIEYSEESFDKAKNNGFSELVNEIVLRRMSRGGMKKHFSWSERLRGGIPGDVNAWNTFKKLLPVICKRLEKVEVFSKNALEIIDSGSELIYLDPPYLSSTRTAKNVYDCEMTDNEHHKLAELVKGVKSHVIISGYVSSLYQKLYKGWNWEYKEVPNNSGQGKTKQRRLECLIKNY